VGLVSLASPKRRAPYLFVFQISAMTFHLPSACFFQVTTDFSVSVIGLPFLSFMVMAKVSYSTARSPERATSMRSIFPSISEAPGVAKKAAHTPRRWSAVFAIGAFCGYTQASSA
jgi:hypothetical protein